jgi:hypothetical protein
VGVKNTSNPASCNRAHVPVRAQPSVQSDKHVQEVGGVLGQIHDGVVEGGVLRHQLQDEVPVVTVVHMKL